MIDWMRLRAGQGEFDDYRAFLGRYGDWPGLPLLRRVGERSIPEGADPAAVIAYFEPLAPQTGAGAVRLVAAHLAAGRGGDAAAEAVRAWRSLPMAAEDEAALLATHSQTLAPHHAARLDMLLWEGAAEAAERMMPRVDRGWRLLARARLALRALEPGVDARIAEVPAALAGDGGLAYERFLWRLRKGRADSARDLMLERSTGAAALARPEAWADRRRSFAREAMRAGEAELAYALASRHFLAEGAHFADLEWLSGYIALRKLGDPARALGHFERFGAAVATPISLGRAGYWIGRAQEALGNAEAARAAYSLGAEHQTSFYGQLAAERGGFPPDPALAGAAPAGDWRQMGFAGSTVLAAALHLHRAGDRDLAERFLVHLGESLDAAGLAALAELALEIGRPHAALMVAKEAARQGVTLPRPYYPLTGLAAMDMPVPPELALSIARRESEFDPGVVSPAGARGLMQLMPGTAEEMARALGEPYAAARLLDDWAYNARLGTAYLAELLARYDGSVVLVSVAYNAGPSRADRWIELFGDPRDPRVDAVDWIEHIPFRETRNYVMRVTESLMVYRARLAGRTGPHGLAAEIER